MIAPRDDRDVGACVWKCRREAQPLDARGAMDRRPPFGDVSARGAAQGRERSTPRETAGADGRQRVARVKGEGAWLKDVYRSDSAHWEGLRVLVNRQPRLRAPTTEGIETTAWGVPANV